MGCHPLRLTTLILLGDTLAHAVCCSLIDYNRAKTSMGNNIALA
jgi:hypothetical protein